MERIPPEANFQAGGKFSSRRLAKVKWKLLVPEAPDSEPVGGKIQTAKPYVKVRRQNPRRRSRLKELGQNRARIARLNKLPEANFGTFRRQILRT